jgi:hypothetical protein
LRGRRLAAPDRRTEGAESQVRQPFLQRDAHQNRSRCDGPRGGAPTARNEAEKCLGHARTGLFQPANPRRLGQGVCGTREYAPTIPGYCPAAWLDRPVWEISAKRVIVVRGRNWKVHFPDAIGRAAHTLRVWCEVSQIRLRCQGSELPFRAPDLSRQCVSACP